MRQSVAGLTLSSIAVLAACVLWGDASPIGCGLLAVASNYFNYFLGSYENQRKGKV